jgi:hypothetical protein
MKSSRLFVLLFATITLIHTAAAYADAINMDDPRRALGREDDVRVDAQLGQDTIVPGVPVAVVYQIQNLSDMPVAIADKVASASYDNDTRTITLSVGSEVPEQTMPHVVIIAPGEKRVFHAAATPSLTAAATRARFGGVPRYVQVKVSILRDLAPFRALIDKQAQGPQPLSDALFDQWFESNDTILLNTVPVQFKPNGGSGVDAENRDASSRGTF